MTECLYLQEEKGGVEKESSSESESSSDDESEVSVGRRMEIPQWIRHMHLMWEMRELLCDDLPFLLFCTWDKYLISNTSLCNIVYFCPEGIRKYTNNTNWSVYLFLSHKTTPKLWLGIVAATVADAQTSLPASAIIHQSAVIVFCFTDVTKVLLFTHSPGRGVEWRGL